MMFSSQPHIQPLSQDDVRSFLARNHVGRLAFSLDGELDMRPLHYVHAHTVIYSRIAPDARLAKLPAGSPIVFEVDEVESVFHWKSVLVRGTCRIVDATGESAAEWRRAADLLRLVVRKAFGVDDPVPFRNLILRIEVASATGLSCTPLTPFQRAAESLGIAARGPA
jgi:uncharacterized protein